MPEFQALYEALAKAVPTINAVEKLLTIKLGGYPRKAEEDSLHALIDAFFDETRAALEKAEKLCNARHSTLQAGNRRA